MDVIIKASMTDQLNALKKALNDEKLRMKAFRKTSIRCYKAYKNAELKFAAYEDAIARIEKELKNAD